MKLLSTIIAALLLAVAVSFALSNRQSATVSLWPLDLTVEAPLYLLTLGTLCVGIFAGALVTWLGFLPHRFAARRLRGDIAALHDKIDNLHRTHQASARATMDAGGRTPFTPLELEDEPLHRRLWSRFRDFRS